MGSSFYNHVSHSTIISHSIGSKQRMGLHRIMGSFASIISHSIGPMHRRWAFRAHHQPGQHHSIGPMHRRGSPRAHLISHHSSIGPQLGSMHRMGLHRRSVLMIPGRCSSVLILGRSCRDPRSSERNRVVFDLRSLKCSLDPLA